MENTNSQADCKKVPECFRMNANDLASHYKAEDDFVFDGDFIDSDSMDFELTPSSCLSQKDLLMISSMCEIDLYENQVEELMSKPIHCRYLHYGRKPFMLLDYEGNFNGNYTNNVEETYEYKMLINGLVDPNLFYHFEDHIESASLALDVVLKMKKDHYEDYKSELFLLQNRVTSSFWWNFTKKVSDFFLMSVLKDSHNAFYTEDLYDEYQISKVDEHVNYVMKLLYKIRIQCMKDDVNYGLKDFLIGTNVAQGCVMSRKFIQISASCSEDEMTVLEYVGHMMRDYWEKFLGTISGYMSDKIIDMMKRIYHGMVDRFTNYIFEGFGRVKEFLSENKFKVMLVAACLFMFYILLKVINLLSESVALGIMEQIKNMCGIKTRIEVDLFVAQSEQSVLTLLNILVNGIIGVDEVGTKKIKRFVSSVMAIIAGGTLVSNCYKSFFVILPPALRMCLLYKFGTRSQILENDVENWRARALSVSSLSKIHSVIGTKKFEEMVEELTKEGTRLVNRVDGLENKQSVKNNFMQAFAKMCSLHTSILARRETQTTRRNPFAFHISGVAGIGKTQNVMNMIQRCFGYNTNDVYFKALDDEYWSGYMDHQVIVMDEFLLGGPDTESDVISNYLTMVSSGTWRPNFASVDDVNVGIKGNSCKPDVVITMNNTSHNYVDAMYLNAFLRRRRFVVEFVRSDKFVGRRDNIHEYDISHYNDDEIKRRVWMKANILSGSKMGQVIAKNLTYDQAIDFISQEYERFNIEADRMYDLLNIKEASSEMGIEDVVNEVHANVFGIPSKPIGLLEAFTKSFNIDCFKGDGIVAQGSLTEQANKVKSCIAEYLHFGQVSTYVYEISQPEISWKPIIAVASGMIVIGTVVNHFISGTNKEDEKIDFIANSEPVEKASKSKVRRRVYRKTNVENFKAQAGVVPICTLEHDGISQACIPIKDRWFLTFLHGFKMNVKPNGPWVLKCAEHEFSLESNDLIMYECIENDTVLINILNRKVPCFKNVIKNFVSYDELNKLGNSRVHLKNNDKEYFSRCWLGENKMYSTHDGAFSVKLDSCIMYNIPTTFGDCGYPVRAASGKLVNKILGIHVAGKVNNTTDSIGFATFVTREELEDIIMNQNVVAQGNSPMIQTCWDGLVESDPSLTLKKYEVVKAEYPNLIRIEKISGNEYIQLPRVSKIKPSEISGLKWKQQKQPAILSSSDPRSGGLDPLDVSLKSLYNTVSPVVDEDILAEIEEELVEKYSEMELQIGNRMLTFEEACKGVPKILNSINFKSSAGYPLIHSATQPGKKSFVWMEGQELHYTEDFRDMVEEKVRDMMKYKNCSENDHRFVAYLKDELVKNSKIAAVKTRMIFANDMIFLVAARMVFGSVVSAFMTNFQITGFAIGLNQYSEDMQRIRDYLAEISDQKLIDGDYGQFDMRYIQQCERRAYNVFCRVAMYNISEMNESCCKYLYDHETQSPFQVEDKLVTVKCSNKSGCFLTTIINCIVNNFYIRYCFKRVYPQKIFDKECRLVVLGDDHILAQSDNVDMNPLILKNILENEMGQVYTSAFKDQELTEKYHKFDEIMFLAALPHRGLSGRYVGALRKETLFETPQWTRDDNLSLDMVIQQMLDCASLWDKEFFEEYKAELKRAYKETGRFWDFHDQYCSLHNSVSKRVAGSDEDFPFFIAQSGKPVHIPQKGLTSLPTETNVSASRGEDTSSTSMELISKSITYPNMDINYGLNSIVRRHSFSWSSADAMGAVLLDISVPYDLINLGNTSNLQNMPFQRYIYFDVDVEVIFQVNGTPVQQGALICYFVPLRDAGAVSQICATNFDHIFLTPHTNTTSTLSIPFRFWRNCMNTFAMDMLTENMGQLRCVVRSPLVTQTLPTTCEVTIYSRFNGNFTLPRPVEGQEGEGLKVLPSLSERSLSRTPLGTERENTYVAQGNTYSSNVVNNCIENVAGNVPVETVMKPSTSGNKVDTTPTVTMDNPPLVGGSIPTFNQFSSMSKMNGVEPTLGLSSHPSMLYRYGDVVRDHTESSIEHILSLRSLVGSFTLSTSDVNGTSLIEIPLNSIFYTPATNFSTVELTPSLATLNLFLRWRADIEFEFFFIKTPFHSARCCATIAYGAPSIADGTENVYINQVFDVNSENDWSSITIPYNSATEYIRTYEGPNALDLVQDYSLGSMKVTVVNPLKAANAIVATSVSCLVFVRLHNAKVYEPRSNINVYLDGDNPIQFIAQSGKINEGKVGGPDIVVKEEEPGDSKQVETIPVLPMVTKRSKAIMIGQKFEHVIEDIHELVRRYTKVDIGANQQYGDLNTAPWTTCTETRIFRPRPLGLINNFYRGWAGTIKYRIFIKFEHLMKTETKNWGASYSNFAFTPSVCHLTVPHATNITSYFEAQMLVNSSNVWTVLGGSTLTAMGVHLCRDNDSNGIRLPEEKFYPISENVYMADISIPFNSHYNFLPNKIEGNFDNANMDNGVVMIVLPIADQIQWNIEVYQAMGDDFRYCVWAPITKCYWQGMSQIGGAVPPAGTVCGGIRC